MSISLFISLMLGVTLFSLLTTVSEYVSKRMMIYSGILSMSIVVFSIIMIVYKFLHLFLLLITG